ncbi:hypothetical protein, partial [Roseovarius sp. A46]|uniref:hypothetical protein n=1 Tax=Roseovarius sp. A46 TaxID=2109331 RepID=UPI0019D706DC
PTAALRHLKAPRICRLLHLRLSAYQPKGLRFRLDESSVAGQVEQAVDALLREIIHEALAGWAVRRCHM